MTDDDITRIVLDKVGITWDEIEEPRATLRDINFGALATCRAECNAKRRHMADFPANRKHYGHCKGFGEKFGEEFGEKYGEEFGEDLGYTGCNTGDKRGGNSGANWDYKPRRGKEPRQTQGCRQNSTHRPV